MCETQINDVDANIQTQADISVQQTESNFEMF